MIIFLKNLKIFKKVNLFQCLDPRQSPYVIPRLYMTFGDCCRSFYALFMVDDGDFVGGEGRPPNFEDDCQMLKNMKIFENHEKS